MWKAIEYKIGDKVGNCTFLKEVTSQYRTTKEGYKNRVRIALFNCKCGKEFEEIITTVKSGGTCGCGYKDRIEKLIKRNTKHNMAHHPLYNIWLSMIKRCSKKSHVSYKNYGGRGIKVCEKWEDINNFIEDMYPTYKKGLDIDRIDNNGNYEPSNCRWISRKENLNNTRRNRIITYNGESRTVSEWSDYTHLPYQVLSDRLKRWDIDRVFTTPLDYSRSHKLIGT